ncbi:RNA pseudouridylate synthase domain-containing protein 2-like isoform X2 [Microcaecilia unicolor]|uniref:RNA pseudouridylate synthase domain-containing protein 2-like isoform X2 n=1 Tax=Microcaecilia unicolor TaxID=1415580 RepID=A0A6P7YZV4_9AMPH|nr:RNA pseudouridylate synthase domain-containing protein 2-like isoform X2 [Microcaecilia unicolor]
MLNAKLRSVLADCSKLLLRAPDRGRVVESWSHVFGDIRIVFRWQHTGKGKSAADEPVRPNKKQRVRRERKWKTSSGERYVPPPKKRQLGVSFGESHFRETDCYLEGGLRKVRPYYFDFETYCKGRWVGKSLLQIFSSEFRRTKPIEYYWAAARAGRLWLNEEPVQDLNIVLKLEKEYVCRVVGEFPECELTCEEPILIFYEVGSLCVDPKGKPCKTVFQRLSYNGKSSVVRCFPYTGRTHQIRVHLQFLGHPIVNDPIYNRNAWGPTKGKNGNIDKTDDELLKNLVEEHRAKQSLDILDLSEDNLKLVIEGRDFEESGISQPATVDVSSVDFSVKGEIAKESCQSPDVKIEEGKTISEGCGPNEQETHRVSKDPLCGECKIERPDPTPKDLVMYLHALRYKGAEFDYSTTMPEWALEHWQED